MNDLLVTATIVTYKEREDVLKKAIDSFLNTTLNVKLYIVDNSPTDDLRVLCENIPRLEYIFNNANIGFGAAHNIIMREEIRIGRYHLVLNPDISFEVGTIERLVQFMDQNKDVGICMPKVLYPDGSLQYLCKLLPTPINWIARSLIPIDSVKKKLDYNFEMRFTDYNSIMEVPYLSGCFLFIPRHVITEIGVFDEGIFMYGEDTDLCRRVGRKYKTMFYPKAFVYHHFRKGSHKNLRLFKIHVKAAIYYFNKWGWFYDTERRKINNRIKSLYITK